MLVGLTEFCKLPLDGSSLLSVGGWVVCWLVDCHTALRSGIQLEEYQSKTLGRPTSIF